MSGGRKVTVEIIRGEYRSIARMIVTSDRPPQRKKLPATFGYNIKAAIADAESMYLCV